MARSLHQLILACSSSDSSASEYPDTPMKHFYMTGYCRPVYIGWASLNLGVEIVDPSWYRIREALTVVLNVVI